MSRSASKGSLPSLLRDVADRSRPARPSFSGRTSGRSVKPAQLREARGAPRPPASRPRPAGARRSAGSASARIFSAGGKRHRRRPPGDRVEHEAGEEAEVRAHRVGHGEPDDPRAALAPRTCPTRASPTWPRAAPSSARARSSSAAGSAASDMSVISSRSCSLNPPTDGMNSSVVPGWSRTTRRQRDELVRRRAARRHGVAVGVVVRRRLRRREAETAGGERLGEQRPHRVELLGRRLVGRLASSPITTRRIAEWPTRKPALTASVPSRRSRYSPNVRQSHGTPACSDSRGMPSTRASMRMR